MIIKDLGKRATGGAGAASSLINYLLRYTTQPNKLVKEAHTKSDSPNKPFVYLHNFRSRTIKGLTQELLENVKNAPTANQRRTLCHHTILSFCTADSNTLTNEIIKDLVQKYISLRGENLKFLCTTHQDTSHRHVHILQSANTVGSAHSGRMSKAEFANLKIALNRYQQEKYPELLSLPEHGKGKRLSQQLIVDTRNGKQSKKEQLAALLQTLYASSVSKEQFLTALKEQGYTAYYRGSAQRLTGIVSDDGTKYRLRLFGFNEEKLNDLQKEEQIMNEIQQLRTTAKEPIFRQESDIHERTREIPSDIICRPSTSIEVER